MPKVTPTRGVIASGKRLIAGKSVEVSDGDARLLEAMGFFDVDGGKPSKGRKTSANDTESETR